MESGGGRFTAHTSFIGRDRELADIDARFQRGARLVTLVGPGGVGKTRLAREYCAQHVDPATVRSCAITLESATTFDQVMPAIASAFGLRDIAISETLVPRIASQLKDQPVFLFLDNFEHVIDAAIDIRELIDRCPGLTVLVTSRLALRIAPEFVLPIEPLHVPDRTADGSSAAFWSNAAVRLFVDRARAVNAQIDAGNVGDIAEIVRRLDGLPLAIELASAAMSSLRTPALLLSRLDPALPVLDQGWRDASARHATMRAAIDWSYQFLSPQEQALFTRLSVFAGGFNLELAEHLARGRAAGGPYPQNDGYGERVSGYLPFPGDPYLVGTEIGDYSLAVALPPLEGNIGALLESLADKNLLQRITGRDGSPRYLMLETTRDYGLEELERRGEREAVRHAHAAAMMAFAEYSAPLVWSSRAAPWSIARVDDELGNLRAAIAWEESHGAAGAELVVRTVEPIWQYFQFRGMLSDARHWLERALAFATIPPFPRSSALGWLGLIRWIQGDDVAASRAIDETIALSKRFDFAICEARALVPTAAALAWRIGDLPEMARCIERALPVYHAWQDPIGSGICFFLQGQLLRMQNDPIAALAALEQAYALTSAAGYEWGMATARYYAAEAMHDQGDLDASIKLLVEALDLYWNEEDGWGAASVVSSAAVIAVERNDPERAARYFGIAATLLSRAGAFLPPSQLVEYGAVEGWVRGILGEDAFAAAYQAGFALDPGHGVADVRRHLADAPPAMPNPDPLPVVDSHLPLLKGRQREVVALLRAGKNVKTIAHELGIKEGTVYRYISEARERWGAGSIQELILLAVESGQFKR